MFTALCICQSIYIYKYSYIQGSSNVNREISLGGRSGDYNKKVSYERDLWNASFSRYGMLKGKKCNET